MLQGVQQTLPRIQRYERELPMTQALEKALVEVYTGIIVFCAHSVTFFRNPNVSRIRQIWTKFTREYSNTISKLRDASRRVDEVTDIIRLSRAAAYSETISVLQGLGRLQISGSDHLPLHQVPYGFNLCFFGRESEVQQIREALDSAHGSSKLKVVAIKGIGGVGKTQLALHYANTSLEQYNLIAWFQAETQIKLVQAANLVATKLGLLEGEDIQEDSQAVKKLRHWTNKSGKKFLLIFDNLTKAQLLDQIWPLST